MEIEYRHPTDADAGDVAKIINLSNRELRHFTTTTAEEVCTWLFGDEDFDSEGYLLAFANGEAVAYGGATISKSRLAGGFNDAYFGMSVVPELRGKGIEDRLFDSTQEYLRSKGITSVKYMTPENAGWRNDFALRRGMKDIRHGYMMRYTEKEAPTETPVPDGYLLHHGMMKDSSDEEITEFVNIFNESFRDHWNFAPLPAQRFIKAREDDAKRGEIFWKLTTAKAGSEPAGICFYGYSLEYNKEKNEKAGWINILGVMKPHRRLGLGRALLSNSMAWLRAQGMDTLFLGMDAENSKALSLYTSQGFKVEQESVTYEMKL